MSKAVIDLLFSNTAIYSCESESACYRYLGVRKGKVCWLSQDYPVGQKIKKVIDLNGRNIYPALTDSHLHLLFSIVQAASDAQICRIHQGQIRPDNMAGVEKRIREIAAGTPKRQVIAASNYIMSAIAEKRLPTRKELDEWTGGADVVVYNIDGHSAALSSSMLVKVGLDPDGHDGILTGWEHESLQGRITDVIASRISLKVLARGIGNFTNQCAGFGIRRVCAMDGAAGVSKDPLMKLLVFIARRMGLEVRLYPQYENAERAKRLFPYMKSPRIGGCGEWEMDGSVGSHSAAFYQAYQDTRRTAECYYPAEAVKKMVQTADRHGAQIASHAIGTKAIDLLVDAYQTLESGQLHRIEHFEFPSRRAVEWVKQGSAAITVQPGFAWIDKHFLKSYEHYLEPQVIASQVPLAGLTRAGVVVCGSSDSPVQSVDPFAQMLGMVDFYLPEESLTPFEALCSYCVQPARMLGEEMEWGTLGVGMEADFFITEADIFRCSKEQIADIQVEKLYLGGRSYLAGKGTVWELIRMLFRKPRLI